jgi:hypothetical protein
VDDRLAERSPRTNPAGRREGQRALLTSRAPETAAVSGTSRWQSISSPGLDPSRGRRRETASSARKPPTRSSGVRRGISPRGGLTSERRFAAVRGVLALSGTGFVGPFVVTQLLERGQDARQMGRIGRPPQRAPSCDPRPRIRQTRRPREASRMTHDPFARQERAARRDGPAGLDLGVPLGQRSGGATAAGCPDQGLQEEPCRGRRSREAPRKLPGQAAASAVRLDRCALHGLSDNAEVLRRARGTLRPTGIAVPGFGGSSSSQRRCPYASAGPALPGCRTRRRCAVLQNASSTRTATGCSAAPFPSASRSARRNTAPRSA